MEFYKTQMTQDISELNNAVNDDGKNTKGSR